MSSAITPPQLNYAANTYLTVYLTPSSTYFSDPLSLTNIHPALSYIGPVGVMKDVQILGVSKEDWAKRNIQDDIASLLQEKIGQGIVKFEVEEPKARVKRVEL